MSLPLARWANEWKSVALFIVVAVVVSLGLVREADQQRATEVRQAQIIRALAEENNEAIAANGDFQSCVWLSIIRPKVIGHQGRQQNAIHRCEERYLS